MTYFIAAGASASSSYAPDQMYVSPNIIAIPANDAVKQQSDAIDFNASIREMRDGGLPVSVIADLMNVERKTVYSWLDGSNPRADASDRLAVVYPLLKEASDGRFKSIHRIWKSRSQDGQTLAELCSGELDRDAVKGHLATFSKTIARYNAQDAATWNSGRGGNGFIDESPVVDIERT
ncbi:UNVERIFIED_ORG: hypothetical protein GGD43_004476 [Rhizobium esperanzae]